MAPQGSGLVARLTAVSQTLEAINHDVGELVQRAVERHDAEGLNARTLRRVGHRLVSLAGDLTTLGVHTARWADDLDDAADEDDQYGSVTTQRERCRSSGDARASAATPVTQAQVRRARPG